MAKFGFITTETSVMRIARVLKVSIPIHRHLHVISIFPWSFMDTYIVTGSLQEHSIYEHTEKYLQGVSRQKDKQSSVKPLNVDTALTTL